MLEPLLLCGMLECLPIDILSRISDVTGASKLTVSRSMQQKVAQFEAFNGFESVLQAWEWAYFFEFYRVHYALQSIFSKKDPRLLEWLFEFYPLTFKAGVFEQAMQLVLVGSRDEGASASFKAGVFEAIKGNAPLCAGLLAGVFAEDGWIQLNSKDRVLVLEAISNAPKEWREKVESSLQFHILREELSHTEGMDQCLFLQLTREYLKSWKCSPRSLRALVSMWSGCSFEASLEWVQLVEKGLGQTGYLEDVVVSVMRSLHELVGRYPKYEPFKQRFEERWGFGPHDSNPREACGRALRERLGVRGDATGSNYLEQLGELSGEAACNLSLLYEEMVRVGDQMEEGTESSRALYGKALLEWALLHPEGFIEGVRLPLRDVRVGRRRQVLRFFLDIASKKIQCYLEAYQSIEAELPSGAHRDLFRVSEKVKKRAIVLRRRLAALGSTDGCGRDNYAKQGDHDQGRTGT